MEQIAAGFLIFVRVCGALALFSCVRSYLRMSGLFILSAAITAWIVGGLSATGLTQLAPPSHLQSAILFTLLLAREVSLGILLAAPLAIAFEVLPMAGRLVDDARGAQFAEQLNPELGRVSQFQELGNMIAPVVFFWLALLPLCSTIEQSVISTPQRTSFTLSSAFTVHADYAVRVVARTVIESISFAAPVIIFCLLLDFSVGLLSRFMARVNLNQELVPVKLVGGLFLYGMFLLNVAPDLPLVARDVLSSLLQRGE